MSIKIWHSYDKNMKQILEPVPEQENLFVEYNDYVNLQVKNIALERDLEESKKHELILSDELDKLEEEASHFDDDYMRLKDEIEKLEKDVNSLKAKLNETVDVLISSEKLIVESITGLKLIAAQKMNSNSHSIFNAVVQDARNTLHKMDRIAVDSQKKIDN